MSLLMLDLRSEYCYNQTTKGLQERIEIENHWYTLVCLPTDTANHRLELHEGDTEGKLVFYTADAAIICPEYPKAKAEKLFLKCQARSRLCRDLRRHIPLSEIPKVYGHRSV